MVPPPSEAASVDPVDTAWAQVVERWEDDEAHRRFRGLCAALGRLPEAGKRYRTVRDADPDPRRREAATAHIDALLATALTTLEASRTPPPDTGGLRRTLFLVATGLTVVLVVGAILLWLR